MNEKKSISVLTYVSLILILISFIGLGYLTFIYFMTSIAKNMTTYSLLLVAVIAGIASFLRLLVIILLLIQVVS